ncbi:MAG: thermonuclease family protein [Kiritimatiellae bacterium]|nr:thermonuclease family protein [Kiritimatiellia bacterium]
MSRSTPLFASSIVAILLVAALAVPPQANASGKKWRTYVDCEYRPSSGNDGDSFHVDCMKLQNGREVKEIKTEKARHKLLRLYYVDTPETAKDLGSRIEEQQAYWSLPDAASVLRYGKEAELFTEHFLARPFTVYTKLDDALGRSKLGREYALVVNNAGFELALSLVRNGLARVYGMKEDLSDLDDYKKTKAAWEHTLAAAENAARNERRGCWAASTNLPPLSPMEKARLDGLKRQTPYVFMTPGGSTSSGTASGFGAASTPAAGTSMPQPVRPTGPAPVAAPTALARPASTGASASPAAGATRTVTLAKPTYLYPLNPQPLGQLRAGATLQIIKLVNSKQAQVRFTTPTGRTIDAIANLSDLGIKP